MYYLPGVTSAVAVAVVWKWIFNGDFGLINYYLIQLGGQRNISPTGWSDAVTIQAKGATNSTAPANSRI
jgi:ABC-type sugar transport system permease subunit